MAKFKSLTEFATKGANSLQVGVILPDTTSSTRYVDFDAPYLNDAFADAGYTQAQVRIDNAQGSDATELDDATADINLGARSSSWTHSMARPEWRSRSWPSPRASR